MNTKHTILSSLLFSLLLTIMLPTAAKAETTKVTTANFFDVFEVKEQYVFVKKGVADGTVLDFSGDFTDFTKDNAIQGIALDKSVTLTSSDKTGKFTDIMFDIEASVTIENLKFSFTESDSVCGEYDTKLFYTYDRNKLKAGGEKEGSPVVVVIKNNEITYTTGINKNSYVFQNWYASLTLIDNQITFTGNTDGTADNAILTSRKGSVKATGNTFTITQPSIKAKEFLDEDGMIKENACFRISGSATEFADNTVNVTVTKIANEEEANGEDRLVVVFVLNSPYFANDSSGDAPVPVSLTGNTITVKNGKSSVIGIYASGEECLVTKNKITAEGQREMIGLDVNATWVLDQVGSLAFNENEIDLNGKICSGIMAYDSVTNRCLKNTADICKNKITTQGDLLGGILMNNTEGLWNVASNTISVPGTNQIKKDEIPMGVPATSYGITIKKQEGGKKASPDDEEDIGFVKATENRILSSDVGILAFGKSEITRNNIKADGSYAIQAYRTEKDLWPYEKSGEKTHTASGEMIGSEGDGGCIVKITGNNLRSRLYTGDASVLYNPEKVQVSGNGDYVEPEPEEPPKETVTPAPVTPVPSDTRKAVKVTAKKASFKADKKVKKYTVTLKDGKKGVKGVKLTIKIGKKTYKAKTNKKGKATFKLKKLKKKGKYTAVLSFDGDKTYKGFTKKIKITVK